MSDVASRMNESRESRARKILEHTRKLVLEASGSSADDWFYINRFVYARLQQDERDLKPKKRDLLRGQNGKCYLCKTDMNNLKYTDIHRLNPEKWYLDKGNAVLVHRGCHQKLR